VSWMDERGLAVTEAGEFSPAFDEVFVMLLEQEEKRRLEGEMSHA